MALAKQTPSIEEVKDYYDKFIQFRNSTEGNSRIKALQRFIDEQVAGKNYQSALDVGCGEGFTTEHLLKYVSRVTGCDLGDERINICKGRGKAEYKQMDFSDEVEIGNYDVVCVFDCLEHILPAKREKFLDNVYRSFNEIVLVTIPEPNNLQKLRETRPNILQIVDEPIWDEDLSRFTIIQKIPHGIYVYYILGK